MSGDDKPIGLPVNRIEALTDGVFAIAMTLLVLELHLPEGSESFGARLWHVWPKLASYVLSFVMLGVLWIGHHYQLVHIRRMNRGLLWLNLWFLLAITFLPFGAAVLGAELEQPGAAALYAGTILLAGTALLACWKYATSREDLVAPDLAPALVRGLSLRILYGMGVATTSIGLAFIETRVSLVVLLALPAGYFLRARVDRYVAPRH